MFHARFRERPWTLCKLDKVFELDTQVPLIYPRYKNQVKVISSCGRVWRRPPDPKPLPSDVIPTELDCSHGLSFQAASLH